MSAQSLPQRTSLRLIKKTTRKNSIVKLPEAGIIKPLPLPEPNADKPIMPPQPEQYIKYRKNDPL